MRARSGPDPTPPSPERKLARIAASQHGVFSREQALEAGYARRTMQRRIATHRWDLILPGVYTVPGAPSSWHRSLMAATLAWGPGSAVSHRAAAALWSLPGFETGIVELVVQRTRRRDIPGVVHRPRDVLPGDLTRLGAVPVTTVTRTLVDLASVVSGEVLEEALDDALRRGLTTVPRLRSRVARAGPPKGIAVLRTLLDERGSSSNVSQSVFETRLFRVLRTAGFGAPVTQFEVRDGARLVAVLDFAYPDARVAIEADGYRWHAGKTRWSAISADATR